MLILPLVYNTTKIENPIADQQQQQLKYIKQIFVNGYYL